jgi:hypothetical protein
MTTDAVPSRPIREWLTAWMIITGDPPETIAKGFDLDPAFVADILGAEPPRMLEATVARELCIKLRLDPIELWRVASAGTVGPCDWPVDSAMAEVSRFVPSGPIGVCARSGSDGGPGS